MSGGQSGVDRAALDVALGKGLACGGWCPRGRVAEDGRIADRYPLRETPEADPAQRTAWNARDSDGTLALVRGEARGGTALAVEHARRLGRPTRVVDLSRAPEPAEAGGWIAENAIRSLNVAGPRESEAPGIYADSLAFLERLLT